MATARRAGAADLASDPEFKWRLMKTFVEKMARKLGINLANRKMFRALGKMVRNMLGDTAVSHWLENAAGIFAAAGVQSPRFLADLLARFSGQDADHLHAILNEGLDAAILGFSGEMQRLFQMNPDSSEVQYAIARQVDEALRTVAAGTDFDDRLDQDAIGYAGCVHQIDCDECFEPSKKGKKKKRKVGFVRDGDEPDEVEDEDEDDGNKKLKKGAKRATLRDLIDEGYDPTVKPTCCGGLAKAFKEQLAKPNTCLLYTSDAADE